MSIPWPAWLGAFAGTLVGVAIYVSALGFIERHLRMLEQPQTAAEREAFARRRSAMRRGILGIDILVCAALGYWIGQLIGHALGGAAQATQF